MTGEDTGAAGGAPSAPVDAAPADPLAEGVSEDRATGWAIFDHLRRAYVPGSVRTRPPTDRMRAEVDGDRFEWHRV